MSADTSGPTLSQLGFGNLVKQSWAAVKKNYWSLFKIAFISFVVLMAAQWAASALAASDPNSDLMVAVAFVINTLVSILQTLMTLGWIGIMMKVLRGQKFEIKDLFAKNNKFWRYLGASILLGLIVFAGLILVIIPGIYWALKYSQVMYLVVDKDMGVMDAFRASDKMTKGSKLTIMLYGLGFVCVNLLGLLFVGLGLFVTIPMTWMANGVIYLHLSKRLAK